MRFSFCVVSFGFNFILPHDVYIKMDELLLVTSMNKLKQNFVPKVFKNQLLLFYISMRLELKMDLNGNLVNF
jgi:hypothetical protein